MPANKLKITKADILLAVLFIIAAIVLFIWSVNYFTEGGESVVISSQGKPVGAYDISEDREIVVDGGNNVVMIEGGKVYMKSASCKNQYCVEHAPISNGNEQIVCLPNKVLVEITDNGESEIDIVAN